jgi:hypothetical protein
MYPALPVESMTGVFQMLCYFFTVVAAFVSFMLVRH